MLPSRSLDDKILKFIRKGHIQVLDSGVVMSLATNKPMGTIRKNGYIQVCLKRDGERFLCYAHRIVALVKLGRPADPAMQVNHIDGNKSNNNHENLEWVSAKDNLAHARSIGLTYDYGEHNGQAKLTDVEAERIRNSKCSSRELASRYNINVGTVNRIQAGKSRRRPEVTKIEKSKDAIPEAIVLRVLDSMLPAEDAATKFSMAPSTVEAIRTKVKYRIIADRNNVVIHPAWVYSYNRKGVQSEVARHIMSSLKSIPTLAKIHRLDEQTVRDIYNGVTHKRLRKYLGIKPKNVQVKSRLTDSDIKAIMKLNWTQDAIASKYGVSRATISNIQNGKCFKHASVKG